MSVQDCQRKFQKVTTKVKSRRNPAVSTEEPSWTQATCITWMVTKATTWAGRVNSPPPHHQPTGMDGLKQKEKGQSIPISTIFWIRFSTSQIKAWMRHRLRFKADPKSLNIKLDFFMLAIENTVWHCFKALFLRTQIRFIYLCIRFGFNCFFGFHSVF